MRMWIITLFLPSVLCSQDPSLTCIDLEGRVVPEGERFQSRLDPCETCTCEGGSSVRCMAVRCAPPDCVPSEPIEGVCCDFHCLEPTDSPTGKNGTGYGPGQESLDSANLGLRLVASTVTSFLILTLLLFMVHRLRQRRLLIMMQRMNDDPMGDDSVAYMSHFDQVDMGIEFPPYEDPPPPYTVAKPPDLPLGEAPPPYEPPGNNEVNTNGYGPLSGRGHPAQAANGAPWNHGGGRILPNCFTMWGNPAMLTPMGGNTQAIPLDDLAPMDDGSSGYVAFQSTSEVNQGGGSVSACQNSYNLGMTMAAEPVGEYATSVAATPPPTDTMDTIKKTQSPLIKKSASIEIRKGNCVPRSGYERAEEAMTSEECLMSYSPTDTSAGSLDNLFGSTQPSPSSWENPSIGSIPTSNPSSVSSQNYSSPSGEHCQDLAMMAASLAEPLFPTVVGEASQCYSSQPQPAPTSTPSSTSTSYSSPESPLNSNFFPFVRSTSTNSQFSVCSETGERRAPRAALGAVSAEKFSAGGKRNPLPAMAANNAALAHNYNSSLPFSHDSQQAASVAVSPPFNSAAISQPSNIPPVIAYVDHNDNMSSSHLPALTAASGSSRQPNGHVKTKTKPKPANKDKTSPRGSRSPRVKRSPPKPADTSYKEYGFIDKPNQTSSDLPDPGQPSTRKTAQGRSTKSSRPARTTEKSALDSGSMVNNPPSSCNEDNIDIGSDRSDRNKRNSNYLNLPLHKKPSDSIMNGKSRNGFSFKSPENESSLSGQVDNQKKKSRAGRKEQRTSERDPQQASVSLDRKRKRPFASRHTPPADVFLEAIITPGSQKAVSSDVRNDSSSSGRKNKVPKRPVKRVPREKPQSGETIADKSRCIAR